jgi:hypothetical protein
MRNLERIVTQLQDEISDLKGRVGSLEAQIKLLQIHLSINEETPKVTQKRSGPKP